MNKQPFYSPRLVATMFRAALIARVMSPTGRLHKDTMQAIESTVTAGCRAFRIFQVKISQII